MNTLAGGVAIASLALMAVPERGGTAYRTHGAVSARPQCGYVDGARNLLRQSTQFPGGTWRAAASTPDLSPTIEANADIGPSGVRDAARVTFDARARPTPERWSCLETTAAVRVGETYTFSFSVKGPEGAFVTARGAAGRGFSRIPLNGRWQRVHLTEVASHPDPILRIGLGAHDPGEPPAPQQVEVLLWGPQLAAGRGTIPYRPSGDAAHPEWPLALVPPGDIRSPCPPSDVPQTAATNLLRWTANLMRTPWSASGLADALGDGGPTPIGSHDAQLLRESEGTGPHGIAQPFVCPGPGPFVASIFVRPASRTAAELCLSLPGGDHAARFDLEASTAAAADGGATARIEPVGKGWLRIQVSAEASRPGPGSVRFRLLERIDGTPDYDGDGTSALLVWGPQVEAGSAATSYIPTFFIPETRGADEPVTAPSR